MRRLNTLLSILAILTFTAAADSYAAAHERFPQPDFETGYAAPETAVPEPESAFQGYFDVLILFALLSGAALAALRKRSRPALVVIAALSAGYLGFFRKGCVCPVGAIQNMTLSFTDPSYLVPLTVLLFFLLPLVFALFFGRVFCSSVCPLGALQELVIFKPVRVPRTLAHILGLFPYLFLGLAAVFASAGGMFIICRFDPFVGFFRFGAPPLMFAAGFVMLAAGVFIARPYCRFICPYGVLLGIFSFFSRSHIRISPSGCHSCRLCEDSCPVGAIRQPQPQERSADPARIRKIGIYILLLPLFAYAMGWGLSRSSGFFSGFDRSVRLAREISSEAGTEASPELLAFREGETPPEELILEAAEISRAFRTGLRYAGFFLGIVISFKIIYSLLLHKRDSYEPDRFHCLSCGRCMGYCPVKKG